MIAVAYVGGPRTKTLEESKFPTSLSSETVFALAAENKFCVVHYRYYSTVLKF